MAKIRLFGVEIDVDDKEAASNDHQTRDDEQELRNTHVKSKKVDIKLESRKRKRDNVDNEPIVSIPRQLLQKIRPFTAEVVFLYTKKLKKSDVMKSQNRLFINKRERFNMFFNDGEKQILNNSSEGLSINGVDREGRSYKLVLKIWRSMHKLIVNFDWSKLVNANNAKQGHTVHIWGYRNYLEKLCFAVHFNNEEEAVGTSQV